MINLSTTLNLILICLSFLLFTVLLSCDKNDSVAPRLIIAEDSNISYSKHVKPIMKSRCSSCHNSKIMPDKDWENYDTAYKYRHNIKARVVIMKNMPPGNTTSMTEEERNTVKDWVDQGGKK